VRDSVLRGIHVSLVGMGGAVGLCVAVMDIEVQRQWMLANWHWVCGSDWPGFIIVETALGVAIGLLISRGFRRAWLAVQPHE
jgi:hypothetical protein